MPKKLSLNGLIYKVRRYEFNSKRCFRYSLYGHSSDCCNRKIYCAFCGSNNFLAEYQKKKDNDVQVCRHCKGDHVNCTNKCDYFKSAKKIEYQKQIGKITLNEPIKLYNSLNKKIVPKLDEELIPDKDVIWPNNTLNKFTNLNNDCNDHIRLKLRF